MTIQHKPEYIITDATEDDLPFLSTVFGRSFLGIHDQKHMSSGETEAEKAESADWWIRAFKNGFNDPSIVTHIIRDVKAPENTSDDPKKALPVGFSRWFYPVDEAKGLHGGLKPDLWPEDSLSFWNKSANDEFFGVMHKSRLDGMQIEGAPKVDGEDHSKIPMLRPHYYLDLIGVIEEYQGKGVGPVLLKWGQDRADAEGIETSLSSSMAGWKMYSKHGYEIHHQFDIPTEYGPRTQRFVIRKPKTVAEAASV